MGSRPVWCRNLGGLSGSRRGGGHPFYLPCSNILFIQYILAVNVGVLVRLARKLLRPLQEERELQVPGPASRHFPLLPLEPRGNRNLAPMLCPPAVGIDKRGGEEGSTYFGVRNINTSCP